MAAGYTNKAVTILNFAVATPSLIGVFLTPRCSHISKRKSVSQLFFKLSCSQNEPDRQMAFPRPLFASQMKDKKYLTTESLTQKQNCEKYFYIGYINVTVLATF